MDHIKELLTEAPILGYPSSDGLFILDFDASNTGIGAVLSQFQDGDEKVISYASKILSRTQQNYCVTRRELLAVVEFVTVSSLSVWQNLFIKDRPCCTHLAALQ